MNLSILKYNPQRVFIAAFAAGLLLFAACKKTTTESETNTPAEKHSETTVELSQEQFDVAEIQLGTVEQKQLSKVLEVNGIVGVPPQNLISISAPFGGFVASTKLLQGTRVKKGDVLAVMEHQDYVQLQQDYLDKKSRLDFLEQEYKRQEALQKDNVNATKVYQQAKADYLATRVQVKGLQEKLGMIGINANTFTEKDISSKVNIYSPISGYVSVVNVNIGKYVNPTDVLFEIVNTDHLHAELSVYEKDAAKLKIGQKVLFSLPAQHQKELKASIHLIGRAIEADRTVRVHAHLEKEDSQLLPGMFITAKIELTDAMVDAIPEEAVILFDGKYYVFIENETTGKGKNQPHHFEMIEVKKGVTENGFTEVDFANGFDYTNKKIVVKGAFSLLAKLKNTDDEEGH